MEFIDFLDKTEVEILKIVEKAGYKTAEDTDLCLLSENYVGFLKKKEKIVVICTTNAKEKEGYTLLRKSNTDKFKRTAKHIKKAIRHEAVHVAQECNDGKLLDIKETLSMNSAKAEALKGSTKISGEKEKEKQAYILEDNPKSVKKELKKYCL